MIRLQRYLSHARKFIAMVSLLATFGMASAAETTPTPLTVFAAASLKESMDEAAAAYQQANGTVIRVSYAASSALARQIEQDAPADVFFSADLEWMDYLQRKGKLQRSARLNLLGNQLVLIAPASSKLSVDLDKAGALAQALGQGRLAVAMTQSVPAGKYARAALESTGAWDSVKDQLAEAENVRAAMMLVSRGEAPLGIVYLSDAKADAGVRVVASFDQGSHPAIIYPVAALNGVNQAAANRFVQWLSSPAAMAIFQRRGFSLPPVLTSGH